MSLPPFQPPNTVFAPDSKVDGGIRAVRGGVLIVGRVALQPFCGLGSSLVAASKHGRDFIGVEVGGVSCRLR
jgi:hypothetical protein